MIVDASVLVAIVLKEDGYEEFVFRIAEAEKRFLSAGTYLEASIVLLRRRGEGAELELNRMIYKLGIVIIPVTSVHARIGRAAFFKFGKGRHPAKLNFGDCFSYALSQSQGMPLLFKGDDFNQTLIEIA